MSEPTESNSPLPGKIVQGSAGIGTVSPEMVEERALELAKSDGRTEVNDGDRATAQAELLGTDADLPPEVADADVDRLTEWDGAPEAAGFHTPNIIPEDVDNLGEQLVNQGLGEADHDLRVSAAEENPPEEA